MVVVLPPCGWEVHPSFTRCPVLPTFPAAAAQSCREVSGTFHRDLGFIVSCGLMGFFVVVFIDFGSCCSVII